LKPAPPGRSFEEEKMVRLSAVFLALAVCLGSSPALATKVTGKIVVTREFREALDSAAKKNEEGPQAASYWNEPNGLLPVEPPRVDPAADLGVVLFQEGAPAPAPDSVATVPVRAARLEKSVVVVRPGSTLRFNNVDPFDHELYSPTVEAFKPERQAKGAFRPIEFKAEGTYEVRCKMMPHFLGWVVAVPATLVLALNKAGEFALEDLAPGKYTIRIFHGGAWVHEESFVVEDKREQEFEFKLTAGKDAQAASKPEGGADAKAAADGPKTADADKPKAD
jgi:plastocyanin